MYSIPKEIIVFFRGKKYYTLRQKILLKKNKYLLYAIGWFIVVTILLTIPGNDFPKTDDWLNRIQFDKWVHIGLFSLLTWLFCRSVISKTLLIFGYIAIACLVYGIIMEFVQRDFIPNRSFDFWDIVADGTGSALGFFYSVKTYLKK